jgi:hypothetical protein
MIQTNPVNAKLSYECIWLLDTSNPKKFGKLQAIKKGRRPFRIGGGAGIRTLGRLAPTPVFKTGAFNHSATPPSGANYTVVFPRGKLHMIFFKGFSLILN